tara:strand:- start:2259 stop:3044 length:786 start_codon:yes stop_codon:yes gene_type:complete
MNFDDFLTNNPHKIEIKELIKITNLAYKNWQVYWSNFISSYIYEDILEEFKKLNDFHYFVFGGYENSDRAKIACFRKSLELEEKDLINKFPGNGIEIKGNFLFDNATETDFKDLLTKHGVAKNKIGDIWVTGERGAQGILATDNTLFIKERYFLRDVEVQINLINIKNLRTPIKRIEKIINTVEASIRIDAIASAGFRLSRNKIADRIKRGYLSLNGIKINKSTISIKVGDKLKLENKGVVEILEILQTKRERWKIKLIRK